MFWVYLLRSRTSGRIYIGHTNNLEKRLKQHNNLNLDKRSYTKLSGKSWRLVYKEVFETREEAVNREKYLKSHVGRDWLRKVLGR